MNWMKWNEINWIEMNWMNVSKALKDWRPVIDMNKRCPLENNCQIINKQHAVALKDKQWLKVWIVIWKQYKRAPTTIAMIKTCKVFLVPNKWFIKLDPTNEWTLIQHKNKFFSILCKGKASNKNLSPDASRSSEKISSLTIIQ